LRGCSLDRPTIPADCPEFLRLLITRCWDADPTKRPSFVEILEILSGANGDQRQEDDDDEIPEYCEYEHEHEHDPAQSSASDSISNLAEAFTIPDASPPLFGDDETVSFTGTTSTE